MARSAQAKPALHSVPGVCEVLRWGSPDEPASLLVEVPHGATERRHYDALANRLEGTLPSRLEQFFHVNTDFGAPDQVILIYWRAWKQ